MGLCLSTSCARRARQGKPHRISCGQSPAIAGVIADQSLDDAAKRLNVDPRIENGAPPACQPDLNSLLGRKRRRAPR